MIHAMPPPDKHRSEAPVFLAARIGISLFRKERSNALQNQASSEQVFYVGEARSPVSGFEVRRLWKLRRTRCDLFRGELFSDPAWDILLELYAAYLSVQRSTVSQALTAANVSEATALRYLNRLVDLGYCEKRPDPNDRRRMFVNLTPVGLGGMDSYFVRR